MATRRDIELFDPAKFTPSNPQAAWKWVDVKKTPNSPFTVRIYDTFTPTPGTTSCEPPAPTAAQCVEDNLYDAFKLYPENYLMPDGRIYLTREGDWVSLRTCDTAFMRRTKNTYWAKVGGTREAPSVSFERGPDRAELITSYGTSLLDPNTGLISILGGQPTSPGVLFPINADSTSHFAGGRGSRKLETFHPSPTAPGGGTWTLERDFLGDEPPDDRTMHYSIILPTRQVLIINGGNFDFYGPVFDPILLTPEYDANHFFLGYKKELMAAALEPRLYHNSAMLLPDGNIFVSGGNDSQRRPLPRFAREPAGGMHRHPDARADQAAVRDARLGERTALRRSPVFDGGRQPRPDRVPRAGRPAGQHPARLLHAVLRRLHGQTDRGADGPVRRSGSGTVKSIVIRESRESRDTGSPPRRRLPGHPVSRRCRLRSPPATRCGRPAG